LSPSPLSTKDLLGDAWEDREVRKVDWEVTAKCLEGCSKILPTVFEVTIALDFSGHKRSL
jgi:hypothetical protein